jgi:hypothetical protein
MRRHRGWAIVAATALTLAACQRNAGPANSAASASAAVASAVATAGVSQTGETADAFIARVYAPYQPNGQQWTDPTGAAAAKAHAAFIAAYNADVYDPDFLKLIEDNGALASQKIDGPDLDYDVLCQCQDGGATYRYASGHPDGARFDAVVKSNDKSQAPWTLVLVDTPKGWRVYDVLDSTGDVRAMLTQHNACLRVAETQTQAQKCLPG